MQVEVACITTRFAGPSSAQADLPRPERTTSTLCCAIWQVSPTRAPPLLMRGSVRRLRGPSSDRQFCLVLLVLSPRRWAPHCRSAAVLLQRVGGVDLYRVPLHEAALQGEVPDRINVVRLDDREDDVVRAEDAQRDDTDAQLLGELRDLAGALLEHLPRLGSGSRAELGRMLGDDCER